MKHLLNRAGQYHVAQDDFALPPGWIEVPARPGPWDTWNGIAWVPGSQPIAEVRAGQSLSFPQLLIGLVTEGWITEADGEGWLVGTLPPPVIALIDALPADERFAARARASRFTVVQRLDPLVSALAAAQGKTDEEIDDFFNTYAGEP